MTSAPAAAALLVLGAGCTPVEVPPGSGDGAPPEPTPERAPPEPPLDAAGVAAAIEAAGAWVLPEPRRLNDLYLAMLHAGDATCPGTGDQIENGSIPLEGCTASTGYTYEGLSEYASSSGPGAEAWELAIGDFYVLDPAGERYAVGGTFAYEAAWDEAGGAWSGETKGTFVWTADEGWLAGGVSVSTGYAGGATGGGAAWIRMDGGVASLDGDPAIFAEGVVWAPDGLADAPPGLSGRLSLRDASGWWYALTFGEAGDGCGEVVWGDAVALGEACVTLPALATAAESLDPR